VFNMFTFSQFVDELFKAHGHRYIKRIPYMTPKGRRYRYIYKVTHSHKGKQAMHEDHLQEGTKFMMHTESGKEVHGHIKSVNGDKVTYVIDDGADKGKEVTGTKAEILAMLNEKHGVEEKLQEKRDQLKADIEQAKKTGTEKQVARLEAQLKRLGGEPAKEKPAKKEAEPSSELKKIGLEIDKVLEKIDALEDEGEDEKADKMRRKLSKLETKFNELRDKEKPTKEKPAKKKPAKAKPAKAVDYAKTFKTAPKLLPLNKSLEPIDKLKVDFFYDDTAVAFFESIIDKLKVKKSQKNDLKDMLEKFNEYAQSKVGRSYNVFKHIEEQDYEYFSVSRFISNREAFNKRAKKIKQGTVIEYPFRELHEKGLGFGFIKDAKTKQTGLGFFVKRGMFQGNAFIMTPCDKNNALGHLATVLQKLEGAGKLGKKEREPFAFLKSVDNFSNLSDQLKEISLIVDDNGAFEDEVARNRLVEDYGADWVEQVEDSANEAHVIFDGVADDNFEEQASYVGDDIKDFENAFKFTEQMSAIAPIYNEIRDHLNETTDFNIQAEDVRSFIQTNDKSITRYLDKAKEALEAELKKR